MPKIEPLNSNYDEEKVVEAISVALSEFYTSLTNKLNKIKLKDILKKKNPYLYRAKGINDATMVINRICQPIFPQVKKPFLEIHSLNRLLLLFLAGKKL